MSKKLFIQRAPVIVGSGKRCLCLAVATVVLFLPAPGAYAQKKAPPPPGDSGRVPPARPPERSEPIATEPRQAGRDPAAVADVVGRDLVIPVLGPIGHVGIWRGSSVAEMLDEEFALQFNTLSNFKSRARYWGAVYLPSLESFPPNAVCNDIAFCERRIRYGSMAYTISWITSLWYAATARYTITTSVVLPQPGRYAPELIPPWAPPGTPAPYVRPVPGQFRCDTFVREVYAAAGVPRAVFSSTVLPTTTYTSLAERY